MSWELLACSFRRCKQYTKANLSSIQSRIFLHLGKLFMLSSQSYFIGRNIAQKRRQPVLPDCLWVAPDYSLFCRAYQALLHIARDVLRIESKLVGVEVLTGRPTNAPPELVAHLVVVEGHKRRLADVLISQGLQAEAHHLLA